MVLDADNPVPLYFQLKSIIESRISAGEFKPGDQIPSENQLCEDYEVSRTTARQAVMELVNSGRLVRTQGRGTFVAHRPTSRPLYRITGFSADMKKQGFNPGSKVLEFEVQIPTIDIAKFLQIQPAEAVVYIKRLRFLDTQLMGLENTYLPFKRFSTITKEEIEKGSLYETLISKFDTIPTRTQINFEAVRCNPELCKLLEMPPEIPLLHLYDVSFDQHDQLFEYTHTYYRGDYYSFHVEINKHLNENALFIQKSKNQYILDGEELNV